MYLKYLRCQIMFKWTVKYVMHLPSTFLSITHIPIIIITMLIGQYTMAFKQPYRWTRFLKTVL